MVQELKSSVRRYFRKKADISLGGPSLTDQKLGGDNEEDEDNNWRLHQKFLAGRPEVEAGCACTTYRTMHRAPGELQQMQGHQL